MCVITHHSFLFGVYNILHKIPFVFHYYLAQKRRMLLAISKFANSLISLPYCKALKMIYCTLHEQFIVILEIEEWR